MGNRRHVWSYYDNGVNGNTSLQDYWYAYDAMNRFTVTMGRLSTGNRGTSAADGSVSIIAGSGGSGVTLSYDLASERKQAIYASDGHTENYDFDALGHLTNTWITANGSKYLAASRSNDLLGRVASYGEYNADGSQKYARNTTYDADSRVLAQSGTDGSSTYYYYYGNKTYNGADDTASAAQSGAGELAKVVNTNSGTTTTTWTSYAYWDEAKEVGKTISGYNPVLEENNGLWAPGMSSMSYDVNGHLVSSTDAGKDGTVGTGDDIRFQYVTNAQGIVLRRNQYYGNTLSKTHSYFYLDGHGVGDVGNDGDTVKDYAQVLGQPKLTKEQQYKNWKPISSADFDQNWQPVGPNYPGDTPTSYTVKSGDTLQGIAQAVWGDASLWYILADANGLSGTSELMAGQTLTLPNKITNIHNNSTTFRPYEAGRVIGDNGPTLPDAPPAPVHNSGGDDGGCGGGSILVAIVIVVVAVVTQQYWAIQLGSEVGGAIAAAATANIAGQATANVVGIQHGFDWGSLATSMVTAGVMSGLDVAAELNVTSNIGKAMLNAAAANAVGQGINMAAGRQSSFNWTSLAVSAIAAPIANSISSSLTGQGGTFQSAPGSTMYNAVDSTTHALVSAVTRLAVEGGKLNWEAVAADGLSSFAAQQLRGGEQAPAPVEDAKRKPAQQTATEDAAAKNGNVEQLPTSGQSFSDAVAAQRAVTANPFGTVQNKVTLDSGLNVSTAGWNDPAPQVVTAQSGDSISSILSTSNPAAIGAFMRLNNLDSSNIYAGRDYTLPTQTDISASDSKLGQSALDRDNARPAAETKPVWSFREASMALRREQDTRTTTVTNSNTAGVDPFSLVSQDYYVRPGVASSYYNSQVATFSNSQNSWLDRSLAFVNATIAAPVMLMEETGREILNVPYSGSQFGQYAAIYSQTNDSDTKILAGLNMVKSGAEGFTGAYAGAALAKQVYVRAQDEAVSYWINKQVDGSYRQWSEIYYSADDGTRRLGYTWNGLTGYRAANDAAEAITSGRYMSIERPSSPAQAIENSALNPNWGNQATELYQVTTRPGMYFKGRVAPQSGYYSGNYFDLKGGNTQIFMQSTPNPSGGRPIAPWVSGKQVPYGGK